jgi:hypothetical protein
MKSKKTQVKDEMIEEPLEPHENMLIVNLKISNDKFETLIIHKNINTEKQL